MEITCIELKKAKVHMKTVTKMIDEYTIKHAQSLTALNDAIAEKEKADTSYKEVAAKSASGSTATVAKRASGSTATAANKAAAAAAAKVVAEAEEKVEKAEAAVWKTDLYLSLSKTDTMDNAIVRLMRSKKEIEDGLEHYISYGADERAMIEEARVEELFK